MMSPVELGQECRGALGERSVDLETGIGPAPNPVAIVQVRLDGRAVPRVRFVVAAAGAQRARPARRAVRLVRDVVAGEKIVLPLMVDASEHGAQLVGVGAGKAVAQCNV